MQYVIFHGSFGSADSNWIPWLKTRLEELGHKVITPQFPIEDYDAMTAAGESFVCKNQTPKNWLKYFKTEVLPQLDLKQPVIFVGHSSAPVFILHILDKFDIKLKQAVFVCPFLQLGPDLWQYDKVNSLFYKDDFDFKKLRGKIGSSVVLYSDNDPYVPEQTAKDFASALGAKLITVPKGGHLNAEFGFTELPQLWEVLEK